MIQITRALARQVRAVFRRLAPRNAVTPLCFHTDAQGLRLRMQAFQIAAEYHVAGSFETEDFALSLDALAEMEGRDASPIQLEARGNTVQARWTDAGIPMVKEFPLPEASKQPFPAPAPNLCPNPPELLHALDEAAHSAAGHETHRFTTEKIQLRASGAIVATDGRQLLWQDGFQFPWQGDVLIPALKVFAAKELAQDQNISIGKDDRHVTVQVGSWTFIMEADSQARYPRAEQIIPSSSPATRVSIDAEDAAFLAKALTRLPSEQDGANPITLDLNGAVVIRAKADDQVHANEIVLSRSQSTGKAVALCLPRQQLARALRLGLQELQVHDAQTPMVWQNQRRKFIVMPLAKESIIPPSPQALRVQSSAEATQRTTILARTKTMARTQPQDAPPPSLADRVDTLPVNGADLAPSANGHTSGGATIQNLIDEAQAMRTLLRSAYDRAGRLITAIKQNDKRTKTLRTALASLRDLQQVG